MSEVRRIAITGVSRGLGRALASGFAAAGHVVFGCARTEQTLAGCDFRRVDVARDDEVRGWAEHVLSLGPAPDLVVSNAGVIHPNAPLWDLDDAAVTRGIELAREAARRIDRAPHLELVMEPQLSVVLFRRLGWDAARYQACSDRALHEGLGLLVPTVHDDETLFRCCFVNPTTTVEDIDALLDAMG